MKTSQKQAQVMKDMTLKERMKATLLLLFTIFLLTGALIFFVTVCGSTIIDIFTGESVVYYSWRDVFMLLYIPVIGYYDVFFFLLLFSPLTYRLAQLWYKIVKVVWAYIIVAFVLAIPLSLYVSFFPLADYYSCGKKGPFSGIHYVKDRKMCEQLKYHPEEDETEDETEDTSLPVKTGGIK